MSSISSSTTETGELPPHLRAAMAASSVRNASGTDLPPHVRTAIMSQLSSVTRAGELPKPHQAHVKSHPSETSNSGIERLSNYDGKRFMKFEDVQDLLPSNDHAKRNEDALIPMDSNEHQTSTAKKVSSPVDAGIGDKSVKSESENPCTYAHCTEVFRTLKKLRRHKKEEHDYCTECDEDFEDDKALIEHRIQAAAADDTLHNKVCPACGDVFASEGGRNHHFKISHHDRQEIVCPGCRTVFDRAAAFISHVWNNKCSDRSGLVSSDVMSKGRVYAALELERQVHEAEENKKVEDDRSVAESSVAGGVKLSESVYGIQAQSLMDAQYDFSTSQSAANDLTVTDDDGQSTATMSTAHPKTEYASPSWPTSAESRENQFQRRGVEDKTAQGRPPREKLISEIDSVSSIASRSSTLPSRSSDKQFETQSIMSSFPPKRVIIPTDWDDFTFTLDPVGLYHCPFDKCIVAHEDTLTLKAHLISGYHIGTDHRCAKCLRLFRDPVALIAHMETSSQRCNIRETQHYVNLIYVITGGFLDVNGDERGEYLDSKSTQVRLVAPTRSELVEQHKQKQRDHEQREMELRTQRMKMRDKSAQKARVLRRE